MICIMTPNEEETLSRKDDNPAIPVGTALATASAHSDGMASINPSLDANDVTLDNSSVLQVTPDIRPPADNDTKTAEVEPSGISDERLKIDSRSPSKSEKSSASDIDISELPSQRSVESMGSSTDCVLKEVSSPLLTSAEQTEALGRHELAAEPTITSQSRSSGTQNTCPLSAETENYEKCQSELNFGQDGFPAAATSSVFCTCASGHPLVIDPCSVSETSASLNARSDDRSETTATTPSCGPVVSEKERESVDQHDECPTSFTLEPNLHLPNERCHRSRNQEYASEKAIPRSNYVYGYDEDYFKNDFVQDSYPILSPQQIPYQV